MFETRQKILRQRKKVFPILSGRLSFILLAELRVGLDRAS